MLAALAAGALACGGPPGSGPAPSEAAAALGDLGEYVASTCVPCHRAGGPAPFELTTVGALARRGRTTMNVLRSGYMPPWLPGDGGVPLARDRRPGADRIERLAAWLAASPPIDDPTPLVAPDVPVVEPDLVAAPPARLELPASRRGRFVEFERRVPDDRGGAVDAAALLDEDGVVGHALVRIESPGRPPVAIHLSPATGPWLAPEGAAWPLRPGDRVVVRAYALPSPVPVTFAPAIALSLRDAVAPALASVRLDAGAVAVPRRAADVTVERSAEIEADAALVEILPDAHLLCRSLAVRADLPDGSTLTLLEVPSWDLAWQEAYRPAEPPRLPAGTRVTARWTWDNSVANPRNPHDPLVDVTAGPAIEDAGGTVWLSLDPRLY